MALAFAGNGTITGLSVGGLPDGTVDADTLASGVGGKVLQVLQKQYTEMASFSHSAGTWTDVPNMSLAITPSASSSKILITGTISIGHNQYGGLKIVRDSTSIGIGTSVSSRTACHVGNQNHDAASLYESFVHPLHWIDSPATTSATTYKVHFRGNGASTGYLNREYTGDDNSNRTVPVSTITLMELSSATIS